MSFEHAGTQADQPNSGSRALSARGSLRLHWPEYLIEAGQLGLYLFCACAFATVFQHPASPVRHVISSSLARRAQELAELYVQAPEVTRRNTRVHFVQPLKERIVREVGDGLSLAAASAADLITSMQTKSEPVARKGQVA